MNKTIEKISNFDCTGCSACYNKCPNDAIKMVENDEGFKYPQINKLMCINCGQCIDVCPIEHPVKLNEKFTVYAIRADDSIRIKSSSGGMFSIIAKYILDLKGKVCGASFSNDYMNVYHELINSYSDIQKLRGSKYLQSDINKIYIDIQENLKKGNYILFSGTPCQVAGLYNYLQYDYENLITCDIMCHGVPSPKVYRKYVSEISSGRKLIKFDFREKSYWGWGTASSIFFDDDTVYRNNCFQDNYLVGFLKGLITRKCCSKCKYTSKNRIGDFTLGDFWGCEKINPELNDKKGTSLVFVNTVKASKIFFNVKNIIHFTEIPIDKVLEIAKTKNGQLIHPTPSHSKREEFFSLFKENNNFSNSFKIVMKKYDIGYVGWWDSKNYGSALTSFAMNRTLKKMGKSVLMLEHPGISVGQKSNPSFGMQFAQEFYEYSNITSEKNARRFNEKCDTFLVGSDQLWAGWYHHKSENKFFFLDFVQKDKRKISYATSFGNEEALFPEWNRFAIGYLLSRFDAISVREKTGVDICKNVFSVHAKWVIDPVFLCGIESYDEILSKSKIKEKNPYIFAYILDPTPDKIEAIKLVSSEKNMSYKIITDALAKNNKDLDYIYNDKNFILQPRIEDWLSYIKQSSFVVSDSFHAFCFSLIFKKNMIIFVNKLRGSSRFESMAAISCLKDRLIYNSNEIKERDLVQKSINFENVSNRIEKFIFESKKWLNNALNIKLKGPNIDELERWKIIDYGRKIKDLEDKIGNLTKIIDKLTNSMQ